MSAADRAAGFRRMLAGTDNPILGSFRYVWDGSEEGARRFLDEIDGWAADSATRDVAADFIEDLIVRIRGGA